MNIKTYYALGLILSLLPLRTLAQKDLIQVRYEFRHLNDSGLFNDQHQQHLRIDAKRNYVSIITEPINRFRIGRYQKVTWNKESKIVGVFNPQVEFSYENSSASFGLSYTHYWQKQIVPHISLTRYVNGRENIINLMDVSIINLGGSIEVNGNWRIGLGFFQDFGELSHKVGLLNVRYTRKKFSISSYLNIGNNENIGLNTQMTCKNFFLIAGFNNNIDFSGQDRSNIGIGYKTKFNY